MQKRCKEIPLKANYNTPVHPYAPFHLPCFVMVWGFLLCLVFVVLGFCFGFVSFLWSLCFKKHIKMNSVVEAKYF